MSELSQLLGTAAPPHRIEHEGKTYAFHLLDQVRRSALEKRFYQQAREAVYVDRDHMTSEQYVGRLDAIREAYEAGEYGFYGAKGAKLLQTPRGSVILLETITGETEADLLPLLVARPEEVNAVVKSVLTESFAPARKKADG